MVFFKFSSHFDFSSKDVISRAHVFLLEKVSSEPGNEVSKAVHYFHIDHNAPCLPPSPSPKIFITGFQFLPGYYSRLKRNPRHWLWIFFGGGGGVGGKESALWSMLKSWIVADGCYSE